jgi:hypothetical protein
LRKPGHSVYVTDATELPNFLLVISRFPLFPEAGPELKWRAIPDETGHRWEETLSLP